MVSDKEGVPQFRLSTGILPTTLQLLIEMMFGFDRLEADDRTVPEVSLVKGGPLGFQIEAAEFPTYNEADFYWAGLLLKLRQTGDLVMDSVEVPSAWYPRGSDVHRKYLLKRHGRPCISYLPFVFSIYGPGEEADFTDWSLLVTPFPEDLSRVSLLRDARDYRLGSDWLASGFQAIYACLRGPNTRIVPGGPLGFQLEVQDLTDRTTAREKERKALEMIRGQWPKKNLVLNMVDHETGWLPRWSRVDSAFQLGTKDRYEQVPFVFTVYGPGEEADFDDWRLLVTPLPEDVHLVA